MLCEERKKESPTVGKVKTRKLLDSRKRISIGLKSLTLVRGVGGGGEVDGSVWTKIIKMIQIAKQYSPDVDISFNVSLG